MYAATLNKMKGVMKVTAQAYQSGAVNKLSMESTTQDEFKKIKRCKRHVSNNTSQTAEKSNKPVPISAAVNLPPKAVLTHNFLKPLRTSDMDTDTTDAENTLLEQKPCRKPCSPPKTGMASTTNHVQHQSDFKDNIKGEF
jgi:hypothetical protein